jgi:hypothetical protein
MTLANKIKSLIIEEGLWIPFLIFIALYTFRVPFLGIFHDDWDLLNPESTSSISHLINYYHDRPVIGVIFYLINIVSNGSPLSLSILASAIVAITSSCLYYFLRKLNNLLCGNSLAPSMAVAFWLSIPWGLGYSLWPTGSVTLFAFCFFLISLTFAINFINSGSNKALIISCLMMMLSFLTYQAWFLIYIPSLVVIYLSTPTSFKKFKFLIKILVFYSLCQVLAIALTKSVSTKDIAVDQILLINNFFWAPLNSIQTSFPSRLTFKVFSIACLYLVLSYIALLVFARPLIRPNKTLFLSLALALGFATSTVPYSLANYGLAGTGVTSRTTVGINFWLTIIILVLMSVSNQLQVSRLKAFIFKSRYFTYSLIIGLLIYSSYMQTLIWIESWNRQNQILNSIPLEELKKIPSDAAIIVVEPPWIRTVEVFGAPWSINPAVTSHLKKNGWRDPKKHPTFYPILPGATIEWTSNSDLITVWGPQKQVSSVWIFTPSLSSIQKVSSYGVIQ